MAASKKGPKYTLPKGAFFHQDQELTEENVDKVFPELHKSTRDEYLAAGFVAEIPAEVARGIENPQVEE